MQYESMGNLYLWVNLLKLWPKQRYTQHSLILIKKITC